MLFGPSFEVGPGNLLVRGKVESGHVTRDTCARVYLYLLVETRARPRHYIGLRGFQLQIDVDTVSVNAKS